MNRNPKRRTTGTLQNGCYVPPSIEKNIRSFEYFPVSRENIILTGKPYGRLGYGGESKFSRENSINSYKSTARLNKENNLKNLSADAKPTKSTTPPTLSIPLIEDWENFPNEFPQGLDISLVNQTIASSLREVSFLITPYP